MTIVPLQFTKTVQQTCKKIQLVRPEIGKNLQIHIGTAGENSKQETQQWSWDASKEKPSAQWPKITWCRSPCTSSTYIRADADTSQQRSWYVMHMCMPYIWTLLPLYVIQSKWINNVFRTIKMVCISNDTAFLPQDQLSRRLQILNEPYCWSRLLLQNQHEKSMVCACVNECK